MYRDIVLPKAGDYYYDGDALGSGMILEVIDDLEVRGIFPIFVIVEHFERPHAEWVSKGHRLYIDDQGPSLMGLVMEKIERDSGESWEQAIQRVIFNEMLEAWT